VASLATCHGGVIAQLDGKRFATTTSSNVVWQSLQGAHLVGDAKDWVFTNQNAIANVSGAKAAPLIFTNAPPDASVRFLMFAVKTSESLRMRETLVSSKVQFRLDSAPANELLNQTAVFETGGWCTVESWKINNVEAAPLRAGEYQIIEVDLGEDIKMKDLALLGDWGRREWNRGFGCGSGDFRLHAVIFFDDTPEEDMLIPIRKYLDRAYSMNLKMPIPTSTQVHLAIAGGMRMESMFSSIFLIR